MTIRTFACATALMIALGMGYAHAGEPAASSNKASSGTAAVVAPEKGREKERGRVVETIFRQPEIGPQAIDACVIGDVAPASERFLVRLANMGADAAAGRPTWDIGRCTGLRVADAVSPASFARGPRQAVEGTAVQVRGREVGIWIDSDHPRPRQGAPPASYSGRLVAR